MRRRWLTVPVRHLERPTGDAAVHTATWDGPGDGPVFVCVHGLGGSFVNWSLLAPLLRRRGAVHAPDLAGFGLTPPGRRRATIDDNLDLLAGIIRTISPERPVVVVGNSMGGLLSVLLAARSPELVAAAVLVAPASPRPINAPLDRSVIASFSIMAVPGVGERWMARRQRRVTPEEQVRETMLLCAADPEAIDPQGLADHVDMARQRRAMPYANAALAQATRSLLVLTGPRAPVLWRAVAGVEAPALLLHGGRDRLVTAAAMTVLRRRRPDWTSVTYDDLGHVPMLEAPARVARDIARWLDGAHVPRRLAG